MDTRVTQEQTERTFESWCGIHGNQKKLANYCGVSPQAVWQWRTRVPAERVLQIEAGTEHEITRHKLRPDLYPEEEAAA